MQVAKTPRLSADQQPQTIGKDERDRWLYSYAFFNASVMGVDGLIVVFATVVLAASPFMVSVVDVMDNMGSVLAGAFMGRLVDRLPRQRSLMLALFLLAALTASLFALVGGIWVVIGLSLLFGFFMGAPNPAAAVVVTRIYGRSRWAEKFGAFNRFFYLGGGIGLAVGVVWLAALEPFLESNLAIRLLFPALASLAVVAAVTLPTWLSEGPTRKEGLSLSISEQVVGGASTLGQMLSLGFRATLLLFNFVLQVPVLIGRVVMCMPVGLVELQRFFRGIPPSMGRYPSGTSTLLYSLWDEYRGYQLKAKRQGHSESREPFQDSLLLYYFSTLVLYVSFGMATTMLPVFVVRELGAPGSVALAATAFLVTSSTLAYTTLARQLDHSNPLRMQTIATLVRGIVFVCIALLGMLGLPGVLSLTLLLPLIILSGVAWAAINVSAVVRTVLLAPSNRRGEAVGFYQVAYYGGMILGALSGGAIAQSVGFVTVFWVAAGLCFLAMLLLLKL